MTFIKLRRAGQLMRADYARRAHHAPRKLLRRKRGERADCEGLLQHRGQLVRGLDEGLGVGSQLAFQRGKLSDGGGIGFASRRGRTLRERGLGLLHLAFEPVALGDAAGGFQLPLNVRGGSLRVLPAGGGGD